MFTSFGGGMYGPALQHLLQSTAARHSPCLQSSRQVALGARDFRSCLGYRTQEVIRDFYAQSLQARGCREAAMCKWDCDVAPRILTWAAAASKRIQ